MASIERGSGKTPSEKYLANLAERSFLDLWSYSNVFIDKRSDGPKSDGKELCDLLVVCGDHVLIFSDKGIAWPRGDSVDLNWSRWFRRAIRKSADQVRGAARWIYKHPDRIFLDSSCTKSFPIELPPIETRRVHGIIVALGAGEASRQYHDGGSGSLRIKPALKGSAHVDPSMPGYEPFAVGDIYPEGPFIHVMDDVTLDVLLGELDTITDFAEYLDKKADFIRSGCLEQADGEEDLLAYYVINTDKHGSHAFVRPNGSEFGPRRRLQVVPGTYSDLRNHPKYISKKKADRPSYVWDELIKAFTKNILGGTLVELADWGGDPESAKHELGVRYMALEERTQRRILGEAILDAMERVGNQNRFARGLVPPPGDRRDIAYVFMLLRVPDDDVKKLSYEEYRQIRSATLYGYVINTLRRNPHLKRAIGIATEPPVQYTGRKGSSEDLLYMEMPSWSATEIAEAEKFKSHYRLLLDTTLKEYLVHVDEYPDEIEDDVTFSNPISYTFSESPKSVELKEGPSQSRRRFRAWLLSGTSM